MGIKKALPSESVIRDILKRRNDAVICMDFINREAGDWEMTTWERHRHEQIKRHRGAQFYSDLIFALTRQYYDTETAKGLWCEIIKHKHVLSQSVGRNVGICMAALDYLTNVCNKMCDPVLVPKEKMESVEEAALMDQMTWLYVRQTFDIQLSEGISRYERYGKAVSLVMMDIDGFKVFNDKNGHQKGDLLLMEFGETIRREIRDSDVPVRYGGDEFAIVLSDASNFESFRFSERVRKEVIEKLGQDYQVTISAGIATCPDDGKTNEELVKAADKALYYSKSKGGNCTSCARDVD